MNGRPQFCTPFADFFDTYPGDLSIGLKPKLIHLTLILPILEIFLLIGVAALSQGNWGNTE